MGEGFLGSTFEDHLVERVFLFRGGRFFMGFFKRSSPCCYQDFHLLTTGSLMDPTGSWGHPPRFFGTFPRPWNWLPSSDPSEDSLKMHPWFCNSSTGLFQRPRGILPGILQGFFGMSSHSGWNGATSTSVVVGFSHCLCFIWGLGFGFQITPRRRVKTAGTALLPLHHETCPKATAISNVKSRNKMQQQSKAAKGRHLAGPRQQFLPFKCQNVNNNSSATLPISRRWPPPPPLPIDLSSLQRVGTNATPIS